MNLADEFTSLIVGLHAAKIEFAVCGALAMSLHGFPRFTKDLDFLVQSSDLPRILELSQRCGYDKEVEILSLGPRENPTCEIRRINKFHGEDHLMVDFILLTPSMESVWSGKTACSWQGLVVPLVSAAGLAKMKRLAGRPQDLVDIETLGFEIDDAAIQP